MTIEGVIGAIVIGAILGVLGRMIAPGRQGIPLWLTILVGIAAAFAGSWLASLGDWADTEGIDWIEIAFQVGAAVIGVVLASVLWRTIKASN